MPPAGASAPWELGAVRRRVVSPYPGGARQTRAGGIAGCVPSSTLGRLAFLEKGTLFEEGEARVPREHTTNVWQQLCLPCEGTREMSPPVRRARSSKSRTPEAVRKGRGSARGTRGGPRPPVTRLLVLRVRESCRLHCWGARSPSGSAGFGHQLHLGHSHCRPAVCIRRGPHDHTRAQCLPAVTQQSARWPTTELHEAPGVAVTSSHTPRGLKLRVYPLPGVRNLGVSRVGPLEAEGQPVPGPHTTPP